MNSDSYDSFDKPRRSFWARLFYDLTHTSSLSRFLFFLLADILIVSLSLFLSFLVHFDFNLRVPYAELLREILLFFVVLKIGFFAIFRVYRITWRYVGVAAAAAEDEDDFAETLREIHDELAELNDKAVELAGRIARNFEELLG